MIKHSTLQLESRSGQVKSDLKRQIVNGEFKPGMLLPTTTELAEHYQVSRETVNQAMSLLVSEKLVVRKRGSGTRVINSSSETVVGEAATVGYRDIGLYLPMLKSEDDNLNPQESPVWFRIFSGALATAGIAKYRLVPIPHGAMPLSETIAAHRLHGIMLPGQQLIVEDFLLAGLACQIPYLFLGMNIDFSTLNYLEELGVKGISSMVERLISLGHQRIAAFSSACPNLIHEQIFRAHRQVLLAHGHYSARWLNRIEENSTFEDYELAVAEMLRLPERPTAVIIYRERFAQGVIAALRKHKVRIPEDISVVVVENDLGKPYIYDGMSLSCFQLPTKEEFGSCACRLMIELLEGKRSSPINAEPPWREVPGETLREIN
jgi:DNA-binding LacI/PurR family transcriptional regulator